MLKQVIAIITNSFETNRVKRPQKKIKDRKLNEIETLKPNNTLKEEEDDEKGEEGKENETP